MSRSSAHGFLRFLVLVVAGIIVGAGLVAPGVSGLTAGGAAPAAIQTRVTSCQGLNFHPINTSTGFNWANRAGTYLYRNDPGAPGDKDGWFLCDPGLPNRAVVTKVQFTLLDDTGYAELIYCAMLRAGLTVGNADDASEVMAQVPTTGVAAMPGLVRKTDTSIDHATIDNASWAYWLQCQINSMETLLTNGAGIYGASVTYQISTANG